MRNGPQVQLRGGEEARGETASGKHVVVVDDDPAMRGMIAKYLESMSFRVSACRGRQCHDTRSSRMNRSI